MVLDKQVTLKLDVQVRDKYGRLLAYVCLEDGQDTFVNTKLVQNGYAVIMTVPPNVKHAELFLKLQREAARYQRGLWRIQQPTET
ncbi:thermonuclease family protein [Candidatus Poribacteria bacterium]|nr:thermonuclease family protein [Candidatus Poribacteria bacterium]